MELHLEDYLIETRQTFYALKYILENLETVINQNWRILLGDNRELYKEANNLYSCFTTDFRACRNSAQKIR